MIPSMPGIEEVRYVMVNSFGTWRLRFRFLETVLTAASQIALPIGATSVLSDTEERVKSEKPQGRYLIVTLNLYWTDTRSGCCDSVQCALIDATLNRRLEN
jgi:hypothetical protein